ncbi:MAG: hypothetical protein KJ621_04700, partial [Proteobacteria bacterium]|nr:hypothetical protein [Pseudomonadota bacterium]
ISNGSVATVLEIKHPKKTVSRRDLDQIESYVDFAENAFATATGHDAPRHVNGLLVVGKMSTRGELRGKIRRLAGDDIRVQTYADLRKRAMQFYDEVDSRLRVIAPEYARYRQERMQREQA